MKILSASPTLTDKLARSRLFVPSLPQDLPFDARIWSTAQQQDPTYERDRAHVSADRAAQLEKALQAECTAHLATIAELRNAPARIQHTGIDADVVSNLATSLACGEQTTSYVAAALLDEVERAKTWDPARKSPSDSQPARIINRRFEGRKPSPVGIDQLMSSLEWKAVSAGSDIYTNRAELPNASNPSGPADLWGSPSVPTAEPLPYLENRAVFQGSKKKDVHSIHDTDEWCAVHPMSRLKALEGVVDIVLGRIAELEKKAASRDMARVTRDTMLDVHEYDNDGI